MRKRFLVNGAHFESQKEIPNATIGKLGFSGNFNVRLLDAKTQKTQNEWNFSNIITDAGLDGYGYNSISTLIYYLAVGTDSTPPSVADTTLGAELARINTSQGTPPYSASAPIPGGTVYDGWLQGNFGYAITGSGGSLDNPYYFLYISRLFLESEANGNLTELGLFDSATGGRMWCRALFRDNAGSPITVTKTSANWLHITYQLRLYLSTEYVMGSLSVGSSTGSQLIGYTSSIIGINYGSNAWEYEQGTTLYGVWATFPYMTRWVAGSAQQVQFCAAETASLAPFTASEAGYFVNISCVKVNQGSATTTLPPVGIQPYVDGNYYREYEVTWPTSSANFDGGINGFKAKFGAVGSEHNVQMVLDEPILKNISQSLKMRFRLHWGRTMEF